MNWEQLLYNFLYNLGNLISAEVIVGIAWPIAVVIICIILRRDFLVVINSLVPRLDELKYKEWSVKLKAINLAQEETIKSIQKEHQSASAQDSAPLHEGMKINTPTKIRVKAKLQPSEFTDRMPEAMDRLDNLYNEQIDKLSNLIEASPRAAIVFAWQEVERGILNFFGKSRDGKKQNAMNLIKQNSSELEKISFFKDMYGELKYLQKIRNEIIHDLDNTTNYKLDTAKEYIMAAARASAVFNYLSGVGTHFTSSE